MKELNPLLTCWNCYLPSEKSSEYLRISDGYLAFSRYNGNKVVVYEGLGEIFEEESGDE